MDDFPAASTSLGYGSMRGVDGSSERHRDIFDRCHNSTQGHHGIQRTVDEMRAMEADWPRMSKDVAGWIAECPIC